MKTDVFNKNNEKTGEIDLPEVVFNEEWRPDIVHQAIVAQMANRRRPVAHTKERGEVQGGGRKPWRQKGTGRARHGSIRSPIWVGGGVTFGPRNEKNFDKKINNKTRRKALFSLLSKKLKDSEIKIIDSLDIEDRKTKMVAEVVGKVLPSRSPSLFIINRENSNFAVAARNIPKTKVSRPNSLNVYDCAAHKFVVFEKKAIEEISEIYK